MRNSTRSRAPLETDHEPRVQRITVPSASRATARPHARLAPERRLERPLALGHVAQAARDVRGRIRDDQRPAPDPDRDPRQRRRHDHLAPTPAPRSSSSRSTRRRGSVTAPLARAGLEHRRDEQRRPVAVGVGERPDRHRSARRGRTIGRPHRDAVEAAARTYGTSRSCSSTNARYTSRVSSSYVHGSCSKRPCACISGVKQPNCTHRSSNSFGQRDTSRSPR